MKPTVTAVLARRAQEPRRRVAVIAIHGIGEQMPYETLAKAADGIAGLERPPTPVQVCSVPTAGGEMRRAEVRAGEVDVHVYEAYWAPYTKGKVTLATTIAFLFGAAWSGIRNAFTGFPRFLFGKFEGRPRRNPLTIGALAVGALVLASLLVVDAVAVAVAASSGGLPDWLPQRALDEGAWFGLVFLLTVAALGLWMAAAASARKVHRSLRRTIVGKLVRAAMLLVIFVTWLLVAATIIVAIGVGALLAWLVAAGGDVPWTPASPPPPFVLVGVWAGLAGASLLARRIVIDYVGDVAAYVSAQKLDAFREVRDDIKLAAKKVAEAVYAQDYEQVAIVGHSLGSVVAYDTLNALLRDDELAPARSRRVLERTKLLLTFGSPLDKTAFIFATSKRGMSATREALATLSQPLIFDKRFRGSIRWVNVWSRADPVSGPLDLYGEPLENVHDYDASTPLAAHNEYWENELVWRTVLEAFRGKTVDVQEPARDAPLTQA